jgi:hypothetical protein
MQRPDAKMQTVRTKRVREARDEAKKEIAEYKAQKEEEYKKFEAEVWIPESLIFHPDLAPSARLVRMSRIVIR